ncbi:hypothetical protein IEQ34_009380 [Dendrobium chrysotoxum]|uniref:Uncharacterized protein n=1 Tax=Dendrobium chrysotoxum TaxID=161865 RepID=A0AAV7GJ00_DENCH|nr:hypothetical protein IEQ34_009380 [Dendrobium chrysotoxum]
MRKKTVQSVSQCYGASLKRCGAQVSIFNRCSAISRQLWYFAFCRSALGRSGTQHWGTRATLCKVQTVERKKSLLSSADSKAV